MEQLQNSLRLYLSGAAGWLTKRCNDMHIMCEKIEQGKLNFPTFNILLENKGPA